jgi:DnaJ-domain-containing protein 1/TM2 domain-containing membrane protein YozV
MMDNYYQILGVSTHASTEEIKERFRFLAQAYHPDKFANAEHKTQAEEQFKKINGAYQILSDPRKRTEYDEMQSAQTSWVEEEKRRQRERDEAERRRVEYERQQRERAEAERRRAEYERQQYTPPRPTYTSPSPPYSAPVTTYKNKSPIGAALLSFFLLGGAGQIYLGQTKKGIAIIVANLVVSIIPCLNLLVVGLAVADAYGTAQKINQGKSVDDISGKALVVVLLIAGIFIFVMIYMANYSNP